MLYVIYTIHFVSVELMKIICCHVHAKNNSNANHFVERRLLHKLNINRAVACCQRSALIPSRLMLVLGLINFIPCHFLKLSTNVNTSLQTSFFVII